MSRTPPAAAALVKEGSEFVLDVDTMIMALGTSPNPLIRLDHAGSGRRQTRLPDHQRPRRPDEPPDGLRLAGDAVTGAATVILAMGAGKEAARAIDAAIKGKGTVKIKFQPPCREGAGEFC